MAKKSKEGQPKLKLLKFEVKHKENFDLYLERIKPALYSDEGTEFADKLLSFLLDYFNEFDAEYHQIDQVQIKTEEAIMWLREYNLAIDDETETEKGLEKPQKGGKKDDKEQFFDFQGLDNISILQAQRNRQTDLEKCEIMGYAHEENKCVKGDPNEQKYHY